MAADGGPPRSGHQVDQEHGGDKGWSGVWAGMVTVGLGVCGGMTGVGQVSVGMTGVG